MIEITLTPKQISKLSQIRKRAIELQEQHKAFYIIGNVYLDTGGAKNVIKIAICEGKQAELLALMSKIMELISEYE